MTLEGTLFSLRFQFGVVRPLIEDLEVDRLVSARLRDLNDYLETKLCPV